MPRQQGRNLGRRRAISLDKTYDAHTSYLPDQSVSQISLLLGDSGHNSNFNEAKREYSDISYDNQFTSTRKRSEAGRKMSLEAEVELAL